MEKIEKTIEEASKAFAGVFIQPLLLTESQKAAVAEYFSETEYDVAMVYTCCGHVASPGQATMYDNICPRCGVHSIPSAFDRPIVAAREVELMELAGSLQNAQEAIEKAAASYKRLFPNHLKFYQVDLDEIAVYVRQARKAIRQECLSA